jgi:TonB family protein
MGACRRCVVFWLVLVAVVGPAWGQAQRTSDLVRAADEALNDRRLDSAGTLVRSALASAVTQRDTVEALFWTTVWHFLNGADSGSRATARALFTIDPNLSFVGAVRFSDAFVNLLESERSVVRRRTAVFSTNDLEVQPARLSGPAVVYPPGAWRRQAAGRALVEGVLDTTGRYEPDRFEVLEVPDSELVAPVRDAMLASAFSPGRYKGSAVRTRLRLGIMLRPGPPPNPTHLVTQARAQLAAGRADSALALVDFALDPHVNAAPGARAYAQLVRGVALARLGRDTASAGAIDAGLEGVARLRRQGVDLAPVLRRLADSLRAPRRAEAARARAGAPTALDAVDQAPVLISTPSVAYPAALVSLGVGGTVVVEVAIDSTGRPVRQTARVVQSPNPALNAPALELVSGSTYRPAARAGRTLRVTIRQPVTFSP